MKTEVVKTVEAIKEYFEGLDDAETVAIWNQYCQESGRGDDEIYTNDEEFFNMFFENKVIEAVRAVTYGEYNYNDEYVVFNGYANLESFNNPEKHVSIDEMVNAIMDDEFTPWDIELIEPEEEEAEDEI